MKGGVWNLNTIRPLTRLHSTPTSTPREERGHYLAGCFIENNRQQAGQSQDRPLGQVDYATDNQQGLPKSQDRGDGYLPGNIRKISFRKKAGFRNELTTIIPSKLR
jgi:hypothetical protein